MGAWISPRSAKRIHLCRSIRRDGEYHDEDTQAEQEQSVGKDLPVAPSRGWGPFYRAAGVLPLVTIRGRVRASGRGDRGAAGFSPGASPSPRTDPRTDRGSLHERAVVTPLVAPVGNFHGTGRGDRPGSERPFQPPGRLPQDGPSFPEHSGGVSAHERVQSPPTLDWRHQEYQHRGPAALARPATDPL